jgi:predicted GNAT superfamily acetyltransferase
MFFQDEVTAMRDLEIRHEIGGKKFLLQVETSHEAADYMKYEEIREEIWKDPLDSFACARNMAAGNYFNEGSSLFIAAYVEAESGGFTKDKVHLAGFSYGFVGIKDKEVGFRDLENIEFYSQYTGVKEDYQNMGLGILIKEFQKKILVEVFGVFTVTCTFDPLTGVNAHRNIHRFQMDVVNYLENCYVEFTGKLNRWDVPLDRFFVSWDLKKEAQKPKYDINELFDSGKSVIQTEVQKISGKNGPIQLDVITEIDLSLDNKLLLVEIPFDFYTMLQETDVSDNRVRDIPVAWRFKTREVFQDLFRRGYSIFDFRYIQKEGRKRDFYVLSA